MTQFLPPNLLPLFAPRDPIPFLPPPDKLPHEKKTAGYSGVSAFLLNFEDPENTPDPVKVETREERQERKRREKAELIAYKLEQDIALWAPHSNQLSTTDAYKTLFVARVNYDTSESKLRREFELYGPIKKIVIAHNKSSGKARGYAFIEYEHERDMHSAYKHADGKKIDGRRVLVDVERGRTVKGWLPRRLGGGLGGTRRGGPEVNVKHSGREEPRADDRYMDRERGERPERLEHRRSKSRSREREPRRRRTRSRSRERHGRSERRKRDRSRERRGDKGERDYGGANAKNEVTGDPLEAPPETGRKERKRSRSRDRDRRRKRSRSKERNRHREHREKDADKDMRRLERAERHANERDRDDRVDRDRDDRDERVRDETMTSMDDETQESSYNSMSYDPGEYNNNNNENNNDNNNNVDDDASYNMFPLF